MSHPEQPDEIEVKFVLQGLPPPHIIGEGRLVRVGYLFVGSCEMRLRTNWDGQFMLGVESKGDLRRKEWDAEIPQRK